MPTPRLGSCDLWRDERPFDSDLPIPAVDKFRWLGLGE